MKSRSFLQSLFCCNDFTCKSREHRSRSLRHETLETRELLAAWAGWESAISNTYNSGSSSSYYANIPATAEAINLIDFNSDGKNDLIIADGYSSSQASGGCSISVWLNNGSGSFTTQRGSTYAMNDVLKTTTHTMAFGKFSASSVKDLIVVYQSSSYTSSLNYIIYSVASTGNVTQSYAGTITVPGTSGTGSCVITSISLSVMNDKNISLQVNGYDTGNASSITNRTVMYTWGTSSFTASSPVTTITNSSNFSLVGAMPVSFLNATTDSVVSLDRPTGNGTYKLNFSYLSGSTWLSKTLDIGAQHDVEVRWIQSLGSNRLIAAGVKSGENGILVIDLSQSGSDIAATYTWIASTKVSMSKSSFAAVGSLTGSATIPDFIVVDGGKSINFTGKAGTSTTYTFTEGSTIVITSPAYHSSTIVDLNRDGYNDLLMIGESSAWILYGSSGGISAATPLVEVSLNTNDIGKINKAVFGDFNGDGLLDFAVIAGAAGSSVCLYIQETIAGGLTFYKTSTVSSSSSVVDICAGEYLSVSGKKDDLAVLYAHDTKTSLTLYYYTTVINSSSSIDLPYAPNQATIQSARLFDDNDYEDFIVGTVNSTTANGQGAKVTLVNNTGATNGLSQVSQQTILAVPNSNDRIYLDTGDINRDGKQDFAYLYFPSTGNATLGYYLQLASKTFGTQTTVASITRTNLTLTGLILAYVDEDQYLDLLYLQTNNTAQVTPRVFLGQADGTRFSSTVSSYVTNVTLSVGYKTSAISFGKVYGSSNDVVLSYGKTVTIWKNSAKSSGSVGTANLVIQSGSKTTPDASLSTALQNSRSWLDEFSNFFVDVWATTIGTGDITSFSVTFRYQPSIYTAVVAGTVAGTGFTIGTPVITPDGSYNTITITGTSIGGYGSTASALLVRVKFEPTAGAGIRIPTNGIFTNAKAMGLGDILTVSSSGILLNNIQVADLGNTCQKTGTETVTITKIEDLPIYPVAHDLNDDGSINALDALEVFKVYNRSLNETSFWNAGNTYLKLADLDFSKAVNAQDGILLFLGWNYSKASKVDSIWERCNTNPRLYDPNLVASPSALPAEEFTWNDASLNGSSEISDEMFAPLLAEEVPLALLLPEMEEVIGQVANQMTHSANARAISLNEDKDIVSSPARLDYFGYLGAEKSKRRKSAFQLVKPNSSIGDGFDSSFETASLNNLLDETELLLI